MEKVYPVFGEEKNSRLKRKNYGSIEDIGRLIRIRCNWGGKRNNEKRRNRIMRERLEKIYKSSSN